MTACLVTLILAAFLTLLVAQCWPATHLRSPRWFDSSHLRISEGLNKTQQKGNAK